MSKANRFDKFCSLSVFRPSATAFCQSPAAINKALEIIVFSTFCCYHGHGNYHGHDNYHDCVNQLGGHHMKVETMPVLNANLFDREKQAELILNELFTLAGWSIDRQISEKDSSAAQTIVKKGKAAYLIELKVASEGRKDRLIPLWSQACLQAGHRAGGQYRPLVIVAAKKIEPPVAAQVLNFAAQYAPETAVGIVDFSGLKIFRGPGLENLDSKGDLTKQNLTYTSYPATNLFSDLNQWMLKVLLAPELPGKLLSAPRNLYQNATELAAAAGVSTMSAFRLIKQLEYEGFLDRSDSYLNLVRREDLFSRWESAAGGPVKEIPVKFIFGGNLRQELKQMSQKGRSCVGLFAAADLLNVGFVSGVPAHLYVPQLNQASVSTWKNIVPAGRSELPDLILRQPLTPESVFRGSVEAENIKTCDIIQIWLDVSSHPSRGKEQADFIRQSTLNPIIKGSTIR